MRTNAMTSTVCYFFFKDGQVQRTHGTDALSAVLHQLFSKTNLIDHALSYYKNYGERLRDAFSELWDILLKALRDPQAGEIICVIDALDECEKTARDQLIDKLVSFYSGVEDSGNTEPVLKFLVTSRPYDDIEQSFETLSSVSTYLPFKGDEKSSRIGEEINLVIDAKIPSITGNFSKKDRDRIAERLKAMKNRTYLWLYLTIDIITASRSKYRKLSSIEALLSNLPSQVSEAYEKILSGSSDKQQAMTLLQLIVAAYRPLSLEEINVALTLATQEGAPRSYSELDLWPQQDFESTIKNICGLFVSVHDGKVSLIHQTAREFLINSPTTTSSLWQGCLDVALAHGVLAAVCVTYLSFDDPDYQVGVLGASFIILRQ